MGGPSREDPSRNHSGHKIVLTITTEESGSTAPETGILFPGTFMSGVRRKKVDVRIPGRDRLHTSQRTGSRETETSWLSVRMCRHRPHCLLRSSVTKKLAARIVERH